ncbi:diphthine--ammonia ligase [Candidatus Saganbacteria bacterium]|nr:diphthine--ammonia ligase [Candidatus Saganbacteria bacterium]
MVKQPKALISWSGGKDSAFAYYKALKQGIDISCLLNAVRKRYGRVAFHGVRRELIELQAEAIGVPLHQFMVNKDNYEEKYKEAVQAVKVSGVRHGVFGDIFLEDGRQWVEKVCRAMRIKATFPLWKIKTEKLIQDFVAAGFEAYVVSTQANLLGREWVGRKVDRSFISDLKRLRNVDICGENGEFHTFVVDGPIFNRRIKLIKTRKVLIRGYWFLDIRQWAMQGRRYALGMK